MMIRGNALKFPEALFPRSSSKWKGHSVVDYGVNDAIDIDIDDQEILTKSRKQFDTISDNYWPISSTIPLSQPNNVGNLQIVEEIGDLWISPHEHNPNKIAKEITTVNKAHLNMLFIDQPSILMGTVMNEIGQFDKDILFRQFHPLKYACDVPFNLRKRKNVPSSYRQYFRNSRRSKAYSMNRFSCRRPLESQHFIKWLDEILDILFEIPRNLLLDLLDEELIHRYDLLTSNNHLGNCLSNYENLLIHPKGSLDTLCISPVTSHGNDDVTFVEADSNRMQTFSLDSMIHEIDCRRYGDGNAFVGIRSDYTCTFLAKSLQEQSLQDSFRYFDFAETLKERTRILAMALNPYFINEAVICLESGVVNRWTDGNVQCLRDNEAQDNCSCNDIRWLNCIYGTNPRSFLIVHSEDVYMYDMRMGQKRAQLILQLPNHYINRMDKLTRPASLHPFNPHQILLSSEQGLIVVDERFANTPLITINHHLRSSPQFMQTLAFEQDSAIRTLSFLGGYRYRDTRCLEFEQQVQPATKIMGDLASISFATQPPSCARKPWKLAPPEDWLHEIRNDSRVTSPAVATRLRQPLIGLSVFPNDESPKRDLFAVQLTKPGDLFYQILRAGKKPVRDSSEKNRSRSFASNSELISDDLKKDDASETFWHEQTQEQCQKWIENACRKYDEKPKANEAANICSTWVSTNDGSVKSAYDYQMKARENFIRFSSKEVKTTRESSEYDTPGFESQLSLDRLNVPKLKHDATSTCGDRQTEVQDEFLNSKFDSDIHELQDRRDIATLTSSTQEQNRFKSSSETETVIQDNYTSCPLCGSVLQEGCKKCNGCNLSVELSLPFQTTYKKRSLLTKKNLGQSGEIPCFELFECSEESRDPLSVGLLNNWENDEFYTPIDLRKPEKDEKQNVTKNREISFKEETAFDDLDESDIGWYLSGSGTLEFGAKETVEEFGDQTCSNTSMETSRKAPSIAPSKKIRKPRRSTSKKGATKLGNLKNLRKSTMRRSLRVKKNRSEKINLDRQNTDFDSKMICDKTELCADRIPPVFDDTSKGLLTPEIRKEALIVVPEREQLIATQINDRFSCSTSNIASNFTEPFENKDRRRFDRPTMEESSVIHSNVVLDSTDSLQKNDRKRSYLDANELPGGSTSPLALSPSETNDKKRNMLLMRSLTTPRKKKAAREMGF